MPLLHPYMYMYMYVYTCIYVYYMVYEYLILFISGIDLTPPLFSKLCPLSFLLPPTDIPIHLYHFHVHHCPDICVYNN